MDVLGNLFKLLGGPQPKQQAHLQQQSNIPTIPVRMANQQPRQGAGWSGVQPSTSFDGTIQNKYVDPQNQGYGQNTYDASALQGLQNPGYVPLQQTTFANRVQPNSVQDYFKRYGY